MMVFSWSLYMGLSSSISNVAGLRIISGKYGYISFCISGFRSLQVAAQRGVEDKEEEEVS